MAIAYDGGLTCSLGVTDLDRSLAWYRDLLGFTLLYRREDIAWCELTTGVERVNVGLSERQEAGGTGGATLTFGVEDIERGQGGARRAAESARTAPIARSQAWFGCSPSSIPTTMR